MKRIRPATIADAQALGNIYVACWRDAYPGLVPDKVLLAMTAKGQGEEWAHTLRRDRDRNFVQVATDAAGDVVGFGSCGHSRTHGLPFDGEVFTLYVHLDEWGMGLGRDLLRALLERLSREGQRSALVWVLARNPSRHFYAAVGGSLVALKSETLWGATLPQVAYAWPDLAAALSPAGPFAGT